MSITLGYKLRDWKMIHQAISTSVVTSDEWPLRDMLSDIANGIKKMEQIVSTDD